MRKEEFSEGTRIYYGGDMANRSGFGTVTKIETGRFGTQLYITMDDGRQMRLEPCLFHSEYKGHGGTRFVLESAYYEWRQRKLEELKREHIQREQARGE